MLYVAFGQLLLIALLLYILWSEREAQAKTLAEFSKQAEAERRELLNRLANPQMIVPPAAAPRRREQPPPVDWPKIGTVQPPTKPNPVV